MTVAYDYDRQEWVTGERGKAVRLDRLADDIAAVRADLMPAEWYDGVAREDVLFELEHEYVAVERGVVA